jgi:hypothetical protein
MGLGAFGVSKGRTECQWRQFRCQRHTRSRFAIQPTFTGAARGAASEAISVAIKSFARCAPAW